MSTRFTSAPLTPATFADFETLAMLPRSTILRQCWCVAYRCTGVDTSAAGSAANRDRLRRLVDSGRPLGVIGYLDQAPVAWISLGPRADYDRLAVAQVMRPVDDRPVWSVVCSYVASTHRGQSVQHQLLAAAVQYARTEGASCLEAYPVDKSSRSPSSSLWFGTRGVYEKAGFVEVTRRSATRVVMRLELG